MNANAAKLLAFIKAYQRRNLGESPSFIDMRKALGTESQSMISNTLKRLEADKLIKRKFGRERAITVLGKTCKHCGKEI